VAEVKSDRISNIKWPSYCRIESLILNEDIIIDNLIPIFSCSPQLHTLIIKQKFLHKTDNLTKKFSLQQLTSLTLEELDMTIDQLESFLLFTPSLNHLKLIGNDCVFDGKRWEEFLQVNLLHLNKFEFFISFWKLTNQTRDDLRLVIQKIILC
jgi:hypothetical protein